MGLTRKSLAPDGTSGWWQEGDKVKGGVNYKDTYILKGGQRKKAKHINRPKPHNQKVNV